VSEKSPEKRSRRILDLDGSIILKWILRKCVLGVLTAVVRVSMRSLGDNNRVS